MKYYIKRELNEYGPYTLADLQRYVAQGNILITDLTRSEGLTDWVPVSQVLGNIAPPPAVAAPLPAEGAPQLSQAYGAAPAQAVPGPVPPDFHWALVLVINFLCGVFRIVWLFVEAAFVKKIRPESNFLVFLIVGKCVEIIGGVILYVAIIGVAATSSSNRPPETAIVLSSVAVSCLVWLAGFILLYFGIFKMRAALEEYYNTVEPINLRLSGVMTFFFPTFYFQYHFTRIATWKKTGILEPQG